jgi:hypothetical protein
MTVDVPGMVLAPSDEGCDAIRGSSLAAKYARSPQVNANVKPASR